MKNYFEVKKLDLAGVKEKRGDYYETYGQERKVMLKACYNYADDIYEDRCDQSPNKENGENSRIKRMKELLEIVDRYAGIDFNDPSDSEEQYYNKLVPLAFGNIYLRLAQCHDEVFLYSEPYYEKARDYLLGIEINSDHDKEMDDLDCLFKLNQGKYYRNIARYNKQSDYIKARIIFEDILESIKSIKLGSREKNLLWLDAAINVGRTSRYSYDTKKSEKCFALLLQMLCTRNAEYIEKIKRNKIIQTFIQESLEKCSDFTLSFEFQNDIPELKEYLMQILIHIGILYRKKTEYDKAMNIFHLVNEINGSDKNIDALNNIGVCYRKRAELYGINTYKGKQEKNKAEDIFQQLKKEGNRFAELNLYKCHLLDEHTDHTEDIKNLRKHYKNNKNDCSVRLILGFFYEKMGEFEKAEHIFREAYDLEPYISRGSFGLKAYYHIAQCKICLGEHRAARDILQEICDIMQNKYKVNDILALIDLGWCLMLGGEYPKAKKIYNDLLEEKKVTVAKQRRNWMRIRNNLCECYMHLNEFDKAKIIADEILAHEPDNAETLYHLVNMKYNQLGNKEGNDHWNMDVKEIFQLVERALKARPMDERIHSGWMICAILYWQCDIKNNKHIGERIKQKLKYSSVPYSMNSCFHVSKFMKALLDDQDITENELNNVCHDFNHIQMGIEGESQPFYYLMESTDFRILNVQKRTRILIELFQMYEGIWNIKRRCRYSFETFENKELPVHYTKLNTLKILLSSDKDSKPRLRLWNSAYMNDFFEGKQFLKFMEDAVEDKKGIQEILNRLFESGENTSESSDNNVYLLSFSNEKDNFQMWSIYADNEKGCQITFDEDFLDIRDNYQNELGDILDDKYPVYKVQYCDELDNLEEAEKDYFLKNFKIIAQALLEVEKLIDSEKDCSKKVIHLFEGERLNEIRFLFKSKTYTYENELRVVQCSRNPKIDENFSIPRLYVEFEKEISNVLVHLGSKLDSSEVRSIVAWLRGTNKVKDISDVR